MLRPPDRRLLVTGHQPRDDGWGGALDNRLRFVHMVLDAIRDRVGPEFIVGVRMVADEDWDKGLSRDEGFEIARRLAATGQVDFLNVIRGHIETDAALARVIPVIGMPTAPHLDFAGEVRSAIDIPVFHAARVNDVATARHAVDAGKVDMIGMTRAQIADPNLGRKVVEGREAEIRPCVGATYCLDRIYEAGETLCIHNPATGREATMPHEIETRAETRRKVVIVGAGPAGLEAARVASARGHEVVVFEAAPEAGGQVLLAAQSPRRRERQAIIDWRLERCADAGIAFRYNLLAEADDVLAENPDIVLIATGGSPNTQVMEAGNELTVSTWDILSGDVQPGRNVLLFDDQGGHGAMQAAELIAARGWRSSPRSRCSRPKSAG